MRHKWQQGAGQNRPGACSEIAPGGKRCKRRHALAARIFKRDEARAPHSS